MNQILSLLRLMVTNTEQPQCLVMALVEYFPARALLKLGRELIERAEAALGEEKEPEPESIVVVPVVDVVPEPAVVAESPPVVEQPAAEPETPVSVPAVKPARKPRKPAVKTPE